MYAPALKIFHTYPPFIPAPKGTGFSGGRRINFKLLPISTSMLKTSLGILGLEYSTVVANYDLDKSSEVESLFLSNVHDGDLTVEMRITRDEESIILLKSATMKRGGYIPFVGGARAVLNLQPGDALEARCSVEGGAHFNCSWDDPNINFSGSQSRFNQFLEIDVPNGMALSSEKFVILINDPQTYQQIELANYHQQQDEQPRCYVFSYEDQCPDGYQFLGDAEDCDGQSPCDKICCSVFDSDLNFVLSGRVYAESKNYNQPWGFYMDPSTIKLVRLKDVSKDSINATLQSIENSKNEIPPEGKEYHFLVQNNNISTMRIVGEEYCESPLYLDATKIFDEETETFFQQTTCIGDCEKILGSFCMDEELLKFNEEVENKLTSIEKEIDNLEYEKVEESFFYNLFYILKGIDENLDDDITLEDIEQTLLENYYNSSSSSSEEYFETWSFDYENDQISTDINNPFEFVLKDGENVLASLVGGQYSETYFSFTIEPGKKIVEIYSVIWDSQSGSAFLSLSNGLIWDHQSIVENSEFGNNLDFSVLKTSPPITSGQYSIKISSQEQDTVEYVLIFLVE
jgi:hypothetical protein